MWLLEVPSLYCQSNWHQIFSKQESSFHLLIVMSAFVACMQIVTESASVQNRKKNKSCFEKMLGEMGHEGLGRTDDLDRKSSLFFRNNYCHSFGSQKHFDELVFFNTALVKDCPFNFIC